MNKDKTNEMDPGELYFITFKGTVGTEVYLTDFQGLAAIDTAFKKETAYNFISYDPENLQKRSQVVKKYGTVFSYEVRAEEAH